LPLPLLRWGGEWKEKAKLMGQDKGSLKEQQMKQTVATIKLIRRINKTNSRNAQSNSHHLMPWVLPSHNSPAPGQFPHSEPSMTSHGIKHLVCLASLAVSPPSFW